jgi:hypothetical protein
MGGEKIRGIFVVLNPDPDGLDPLISQINTEKCGQGSSNDYDSFFVASEISPYRGV